MFGALRPDLRGMSAGERARYQRLYCGLCKSLGQEHGQLHRGTLTHDATFLALLVDALSPEAAAPDQVRCPMAPWRVKSAAAPSSPAMQFAAHMQVALADQYVADKAIDGSALAGGARRLTRGPAERASARLRAIGVELGDLDRFEHEQKRLEVEAEPGPEAAAAPTADAVARVLVQLPGVSGIAPALASVDQRARLERAGRAMGRAIYLLDALEDLEDDLRTGDFNPLVESDGAGRRRLSRARLSRCGALIASDRADLEEAIAALPLHRNRDLIEGVLLERLIVRAEAAHAEAEARELAARPRRPFERWWALLWAWLGLLFPGLALASPPSANNDLRQILSCCCDPVGSCEDIVEDFTRPFCELCELCTECPKACDECSRNCDNCSQGCNDCSQGCSSVDVPPGC